MPINHAIWKVGSSPAPLTASSLANEKTLEDMIVAAPDILSSQWMIIGRQEQTGFGGCIDLLAIAPDASLILIELKRNKTPREIVAQAIDYASWVEQLTAERIAQIYQLFSNGGNLDEGFEARFGEKLDEETLNDAHLIILVAAELDSSTERIINYLNSRDIPINVVFFQVFQHGSEQLLSRAWLIDPGETQANVATGSKRTGPKEPWNGEFYVSFGEGPSRLWEDARKYGFISAGSGTWYTQTLNLLKPSDRIWVRIPKVGYVGVGRVTEPAQSLFDFQVKTREGDRSCLDILKTADYLRKKASDPEMVDYFVRVEWLDTVPAENAVHEVGLFGNQNTVCQPTVPRWRHTIDRLKTIFKNWDRPVRHLSAER